MSYTELKATYPKGRKKYRCEWCDEQILVGEKHFYRSFIIDGDFNTGRMHLECEEAMKKTPNDDLMDGWMPGDFKRGEMTNDL